MKRLTAVAKVFALAAIAATSGLAPAATQDLTLSATVTAQCKFTSAATNMGFGSVDPSLPGPIPGVLGTPVTYKCTKGHTPGTVSASVGLNTSNRMKHATSSEYIPYTLTIGAAPAGSGFGSTQDKTLPVTASIAAADYENVTAGAYSDTVVLTVSP